MNGICLSDNVYRMLLIRRFEEELIRLHEAGEFPGHYHVYIGQEATGVGIVSQLRDDDVIFTTHRNHGHLLARGSDPTALLTEILGRAGGVSNGRSGTLHLSDPDRGVPVTSAMVGGSLPLATGSAFGLSRKERSGDGRAVVVCSFGDGVFEEGAIYEALNIASLWDLPIVYVCENNSVPPSEWTQGEYPSSSFSGGSFVDVVRAFGIEGSRCDGRRLDVVERVFAGVLGQVRVDGRPRFLEVRTERWPGSRPMFPTLAPWGVFEVDEVFSEDPQTEGDHGWKLRSDPLALTMIEATRTGSLSRSELKRLDEDAKEAVKTASVAARSAPMPDVNTLFEHIRA